MLFPIGFFRGDSFFMSFSGVSLVSFSALFPDCRFVRYQPDFDYSVWIISYFTRNSVSFVEVKLLFFSFSDIPSGIGFKHLQRAFFLFQNTFSTLNKIFLNIFQRSSRNRIDYEKRYQLLVIFYDVSSAPLLLIQ